MTAAQALEVLDQATAMLELKRKEHAIVIQALQTLQELTIRTSNEDSVPEQESQTI